VSERTDGEERDGAQHHCAHTDANAEQQHRHDREQEQIDLAERADADEQTDGEDVTDEAQAGRSPAKRNSRQHGHREDRRHDGRVDRDHAVQSLGEREVHARQVDDEAEDDGCSKDQRQEARPQVIGIDPQRSGSSVHQLPDSHVGSYHTALDARTALSCSADNSESSCGGTPR